jgi:hypothetical protein
MKKLFILSLLLLLPLISFHLDVQASQSYTEIEDFTFTYLTNNEIVPSLYYNQEKQYYDLFLTYNGSTTRYFPLLETIWNSTRQFDVYSNNVSLKYMLIDVYYGNSLVRSYYVDIYNYYVMLTISPSGGLEEWDLLINSNAYYQGYFETELYLEMITIRFIGQQTDIEQYYAGYNDGYDTGIDSGYEYGYDAGQIQGYQDGLNSGQNTLNTDTYNQAYDSGYNTGYNEGVDYATDNNISILSVISLFFGVILSLFTWIAEIQILNISIATIIGSLAVGLVLIWVLKLIRG